MSLALRAAHQVLRILDHRGLDVVLDHGLRDLGGQLGVLLPELDVVLAATLGADDLADRVGRVALLVAPGKILPRGPEPMTW